MCEAQSTVPFCLKIHLVRSGRIAEVSRWGTLSKERTQKRQYEFPVFKARTQMLAVQAARHTVNKPKYQA